MGSLGLDGSCPHAVRLACPEAHLLQFASSILEEPILPEVLASSPCRKQADPISHVLPATTRYHS